MQIAASGKALLAMTKRNEKEVVRLDNLFFVRSKPLLKLRYPK